MFTYPTTYDVLVVGGGHSGCEAAHAAARMGMKTLLLTMNIDTIGHMSCNPAVGGMAKGHLVREIDALGGIMGRIADRAAIHSKRLNMSKGPAVRSTRQQSDMRVYRREMQTFLMDVDNLDIKQGSAEKFILDEDGKRPVVRGVVDQLGVGYRAKTVVLTTGTFLRGLCHVGSDNFKGGRAGDRASYGMAEQLMSLELELGRLKTGTPPRLHGRSINWDVCEEQPGDEDCPRFSFYHNEPKLRQVSCYVTYTNEKTHQVIQDNLDRSPMFSGQIEGIGPRYCPSIEDKVHRFADKDRHHIFLEPQGLDTAEVYPNGISTSLPFDVQIDIVRSIEGLENAEVIRPGYAVEYDFVNPVQLHATLELTRMPGLFLAGQINGTSGYEEAGAQGIIAGINAALKVQREDPFILGRDESYIGVLIDDLTTRGTSEPYRMFTSRAEYRLILREDNADRRLSRRSHEIGLLDDASFAKLETKEAAIEEAIAKLRDARITPTDEMQERMKNLGLGSMKTQATLDKILKRPESDLATVSKLLPELSIEELDPVVAEAVEIELKYEDYIERQRQHAAELRKTDKVRIPEDFVYDDVPGLSNEVCEKLDEIRPSSLGQASRIQGITPAAITNLWLWIKKKQEQAGAA
jgi:tRNA uridine 5-carboxymethylaminomethyl modification enzyme